ncbi:MAG: hypothetical protein WDO73_03580 [Ignavibacteriota bacterium]
MEEFEPVGSLRQEKSRQYVHHGRTRRQIVARENSGVLREVLQKKQSALKMFQPVAEPQRPEKLRMMAVSTAVQTTTNPNPARACFTCDACSRRKNIPPADGCHRETNQRYRDEWQAVDGHIVAARTRQ